MIGQNVLKQLCKKWNEDPAKIPSLLLIVGPQDTGKKTAVEYIRKNVKNDGMFRAEANSVSAVREVIEKSYQLGGAVYYVFTDCDNMSVAAKNAMLKVMEEPPQGARFILTVKNYYNMLNTIRSRAFLYQMFPYSKKELENFVATYDGPEKVKAVKLGLPYSNCPGNILRLAKMPDAGQGMIDYARLMADYVGEATQANVLKISTKLDIKNDDPDKYPVDLFLYAAEEAFFKQYCKTHKVRDYACMKRVSGASAELNLHAASKQNLIDCLLLDLRRMQGAER